MPRVPLGAVLIFLFLLMTPNAGEVAGAPLLPAEEKSGSQSLLPYLEYFLDESAAMDIEEISAPELAASFAPFSADKLPAATGVLWLRFGIAHVAPGARAPLQVLDMGPDVPGAAVLYAPSTNELSGTPEWREIIPGRRDIILLPEAGAATTTCYLRLDGLPGFWFSPTVRSPEDAATNWGSLSRAAAILALGVVLCLCLVRWVTERGQWRVWTALFTAVALLQALVGLPPQVGNPGLWGLCGILSPGIALMLLPHVARHLMRIREQSRAVDIQLFLLTLPGMGCALLPLLPGWSWIDRWIELWPVCTLIFLPTALGAWLMGLAGSRRFLLACLIPPFFTALGVCGVYFGVSPQVLASAPVWGIAFAAILLAATRAPDYAANDVDEESAPTQSDNGDIITLDAPLGSGAPKNLDLGWFSGSRGEGDLAAKLSTMNDPNLRLATSGDEKPASPPVLGARSFTDCEAALREPLDDLMRAGAALQKCSLTPAVRQSVENMLLAARKMAGIVSGGPIVGPASGNERETTFNLQHLVREAHDSVAQLAENNAIALAWYMPPHLPQLYRGCSGQLAEVLQLLLESAVRATKSGTVRLSARRVPGSSDPGNLLFTVSDTGSGHPPAERSAMALVRAWELVGSHNGFISMECGEQGSTIAFSLRFTPLDAEGKNDARPAVAIMCENDEERRDIIGKLQGLDARLVESSSPRDLLAAQTAAPAGMLIVRGEMASPAAAEMLSEFVAKARGAGYGVCKIMAVHSDNSQDRQLASSGFTHAIPEPLDAEELRGTVRALLKVVENNRTHPAPDKDAPPARRQDLTTKEPSESEMAAPTVTIEETREKPRHDTQNLETQLGEERDKAAPRESLNVSREENDGVLDGGGEAKKIPDIASIHATGPAEEALMDNGMSLADEQPNAQADAQPGRPIAESARDIPDSEISENPGAILSPDGTDAEIAEVKEEEIPAPTETPPADAVEPSKGVESAGPICSQTEAAANAAPEKSDMGAAANADMGASGESTEETAFVEASQADSMEETTAQPSPNEREEEGETGIEREASENAGAPDHGGAPADLEAVEWVGEPTPIEKAATEASGGGENSDTKEKTAQPERRPVKISLPEEGFVEWVGEPMPIGTDPASMKKRQPAASASSPPERLERESEKILPKLEEPPREHGNLLGDFVSRTISQVSATIEKLTRGAPDPERVQINARPASGAPGRTTQKVARENAGQPASKPVPSGQAGTNTVAGNVGAESERQARKIDPAVFELVDGLDRSLDRAHKAFAVNNAYAVAEAAARISDDAQKFGLRHLSKLAQCVVRAGRAGDMGALRDILPDLDAAVERNRITLTRMQ